MIKGIEKIGKLFGKMRKVDYRHYILSVITLGFLALSIFVFPNGIIRIWESLQDLFWSICYYGNELFEFGFRVRPTVNDYSSIPFTPIWGLPETWEEFQAAWVRYWGLLFSGDNFSFYVLSLSDGAYFFSRLILLVVFPLFLLGIILFQRYLQKHNNNYDEDSKALRAAKWLADNTYVPVKLWVSDFIIFFRENKIYRNLWLLIWCYNFNVVVIIIEFFAYYFYFAISFDFLNIYRQVYKLFCDLSPMIAFVPGFVWVIVGLVVFHFIRRKIAFSILYWHEARNCGFINERPIVTMTCGTMGKKKTTMIADMNLLQEKMFREKALKLMIENDMKFPNFPWINLENFMRYAMKEHIVYNLASIRKTFGHLKSCFNEGLVNPEYRSSIRRHLKKRYRLPFGDCIFGYDYARYGLTYDDQLKVTDIWSVITSYAQEYFVYVLKSSLILANFSVRTDSVLDDLGNLPMRDNDFYHRNSAFIYELSRYANIIDYNALRLGRKLGDEEDPKKDSFEFGSVGITEVGKERKNNLQLQEMKKKDEGANQKNDGFNDWLKMIRHSATIDYYPFVKVFTDEQRPESWGADARDLCEIIHIRESSETKLAMPFFALEELVYTFVYDKFVSLYLKYRHVRSDNTLPMYVLKKVIAKLQKYYKDTYNLFGYNVLKVQVESGTQDGELDSKVYYLDSKRIYSDRFSTDAFSDFFTTKALRSSVGFDDLEEYGSSKATLEELQMQNSYFVADLMNKQENDK